MKAELIFIGMKNNFFEKSTTKENTTNIQFSIEIYFILYFWFFGISIFSVSFKWKSACLSYEALFISAVPMILSDFWKDFVPTAMHTRAVVSGGAGTPRIWEYF